jgi:hypothetical protein
MAYATHGKGENMSREPGSIDPKDTKEGQSLDLLKGQNRPLGSKVVIELKVRPAQNQSRKFLTFLKG